MCRCPLGHVEMRTSAAGAAMRSPRIILSAYGQTVPIGGEIPAAALAGWWGTRSGAAGSCGSTATTFRTHHL
jgi:hypothetical protein